MAGARAIGLRAGVVAAASGLALTGLAFPAAAGGQGNGATGDPNGNVGTIKVEDLNHGAGTDVGPDNDPQLSCDSGYVEFYGFDPNERGTLSFYGQAPTSSNGTALWSTDVRLANTRHSGAAQDWDGEVQFDAAALENALGTPANHGYHIRVEFLPQGKPGGAKTKVFWLAPCGGHATPRTRVLGESFSRSAPDTRVLGESFSRTPPTTRVLALSVSRRATLPFTGVPTVPLLAAALGSLLAGTGLVLWGRRRAALDTG